MLHRLRVRRVAFAYGSVRSWEGRCLRQRSVDQPSQGLSDFGFDHAFDILGLASIFLYLLEAQIG